MKYPFLFSSSERRGLYLLLLLAFLFIGAKYFIQPSEKIYLANALVVKENFRKDSLVFQKKYSSSSMYSKYNKAQKNDFVKYEKNKSNDLAPVRKKINVELNSASKEQLIELNGIGESYATRILKYREILGGYVSENQLLQVYGMDTVLFNKIKNNVHVDISLVKKYNINEASSEELGEFKRIGVKRAKVIVAYRNQHGNFSSVKDLMKTKVFSDSLLYLIEPYIILQ